MTRPTIEMTMLFFWPASIDDDDPFNIEGPEITMVTDDVTINNLMMLWPKRGNTSVLGHWPALFDVI